MLKEKVPETKPEKEAALVGRSVFPAFFETPFPFMQRFAEDVERMFEDFGRMWPTPFWRRVPRTKATAWIPAVEILEQNGDFVVRAELPGLTKKDVKVEITDEVLTIEGERKLEKEEKGEGFYRSERSYGTFYRAIPLPEGIEPDKAKATFTDGVLEIRLPAPPRKGAVKGRKLEIEEAAAEKAKPAA
jgi:HSP20 family protein